MKSQMFLMAIILTVAASFSSQAYGGEDSKPIICHTPRMNVAFKVDNNHIAFLQKKRIKDSGREIASAKKVQCGTRITPKGFTKVVHFEGKKHEIHVQDSQKFSSLNDYVVITNREGHQMTYPLNCESY